MDIDLSTRMKVLSNTLLREISHEKSHEHPIFKLTSVEDFQPIYELFNQEKISKDCLFVTKDLFAYLKTVYYPEGMYIITNYYTPILEIHLGKFDSTYYDTIDIHVYKKKLAQNSWLSFWVV